jgi:glucose dehydrogenase
MYPAPGSHGGMGNFIAWDAGKGKNVWSKPEQFSVWSGALAGSRRNEVQSPNPTKNG